MQRSHWRNRARLSSVADAVEAFLAKAGFDRGPWLAVAFASGIALWFWLDNPVQWIVAIGSGLALALGALAGWRGAGERANLVAACVGVGLLMAAGTGVAWLRSSTVGAPALERPASLTVTGRVLDRIEQPAQERTRLVLAARNPDSGEPIKLRVNVPLEQDSDALTEGAVVRLRARLMPPAPPMLPGGYDFARAAWFEGYAATGSVQGEIDLLEPGEGGALLGEVQRDLSSHVRNQLGGSAGTIAAAFASGDRGAIAEEDEEAMRDAGLTHLLSISGLHVSAVIAAAYFLALKIFALSPWLALRVRLPILAAAGGASAGIFYTLLTGAQVPTVRSCVAALLVLGALALGREALSLRIVAAAAVIVLLLWPETLVGPSFQMSFAAVIAIVALHNAGPVRDFLAPREESWAEKTGRRALMLLLTGLVIEIALMPIVLFHFHRAGLYGALANVIAIPLVTFCSMPLIAFALFLDLAGLGAPIWWLAGKSLDLMLAIAHFTASRPGAVKLVPQLDATLFMLFVAGGLWLALWQGRARLFGLLPAALATLLLLTTRVPDLLISSDGRHVGIVTRDDNLISLRDTRTGFARDNLMEMGGVEAMPVPIEQWPGAKCSSDFCQVTLSRGGRDWQILMSRSRTLVSERALSAACSKSHIVISSRWLPYSCRPQVMKADGRLLSQTGGISIDLVSGEIRTVAQSQGEHGWWRGRGDR